MTATFAPRILTKPFAAGDTFESLIEGHAAVCFRKLIPPAEIEKMIKGFYAAKEVWSEGFGGQQYALGDAWYHYAEEGIDFEEYGSKAEQSRANVEKFVPGLEGNLLGFLSPLARPGTLSIREGWAGPGFMMFPAGGFVANKGGSIHFDTDAFSDEELYETDLVMFSLICMIQKPERGGNLTVWNKPFDKTQERFQSYNPATQGAAESYHIEYQPGDLWMIRGMNAHQIGAFEGKTDRICLTFHVYKEGDDWFMWF